MDHKGLFREWLDAGDSDKSEKKLISFAGKIRPIVRDRIQTELSKNLKEITKEITSAFYDAFSGKLRNGNQAVTIWEIPLSPRPILLDGRRVSIGTAVVAYQLPIPQDNKANPKTSGLSREEKEKFIREREKYFTDFIKNSVTDEDALDSIVDDLVQRIYRAIRDTTSVEGPEAKVVWRSKVTSRSGKRFLGRILIAHRLHPQDERELERAVQDV